MRSAAAVRTMLRSRRRRRRSALSGATYIDDTNVDRRPSRLAALAPQGDGRRSDLLSYAHWQEEIMLDVTKPQSTAPFDTARLDRLMDESGLDVLVVTTKHNVQYLLGGHRSFFFESMDAMGLSRYLPVFVYAKGEPQKAGFFGHRMENFQYEVK